MYIGIMDQDLPLSLKKLTEFKIVSQEYKEQDVNIQLKSQLHFKTEIDLKNIQVDKAILVDKKEFMDLLENPYSNRDYIKNNIDQMFVKMKPITARWSFVMKWKMVS